MAKEAKEKAIGVAIWESANKLRDIDFDTGKKRKTRSSQNDKLEFRY